MSNDELADCFRIREAKLCDIEHIFRIQQESLWVDKEDKDWLSAFIKIKSRRRLVLVAEKMPEGLTVGFLSAYKYRDTAYIDVIAISKDYRSKGVGSLLLDKAEEELREKGVKTVTLSVKKENTKALDFYLRKDYYISKVVLVLEAKVSMLTCYGLSSEYTVGVTSPARIRRNTLRRATWWSTLIEPVDRLIYKKMYKKGEAVVVLKKKRIKGFAEYSLDSIVDVDNIAISSYLDTETLRILVCKLAEIGLAKNINLIRIYVDSSKTMIIKELENLGFRVVDAEFLLEKELVNENEE
jgi:ribosomal protein S18 acetylase RimI-like enzyme